MKITHRRGVQILDYSEVDLLLRQGLTQQEVADRFGVTQAAISQARVRGRVKSGRTRADSILPWSIKAAHRNLNVPKMLRCAARMEKGEDIGANEAQTVRFVQTLREQGSVIHYEPNVAPYFFRVAARPEIDTWLVRVPDSEG